MVVSRLPITYFEQEETLNFDLFAFILEDFSAQRAFADKTKRMVRQLSENECFAFILDYSESASDIDNLVKAFGTEWKSFISSIFAGLNIGEAPAEPQSRNHQFVKKYAHTLFRLVGEKSTRLSFINEESKTILSGYVSEDSEFLTASECDFQSIATGLKLYGVSFNSINAEAANGELLKLIYANNSYVINYGNIETMVKVFYESSSLNDLRTANYSTVMTEPSSSLAKYLNANIDEYMAVILSECGKAVTDASQNVIALLNNPNIDEDRKITYISYLQTTIGEILDIEDAMWSELLSNPVAVEYSAQNVVAYYTNKCNGILDAVLVDYIKSKGTAVTVSKNDFANDNEYSNFFSAIVKTTSLPNAIYKGFIEQFNLQYHKFSIVGLPSDKLVILDELGKIKMSAESLAFIRENYNDYLYAFIERHIDQYVQVVSENESGLYLREEMLGLLNAKISDTNKISLLDLESNPITVIGKKYSDEVCAYILQNNYDESDFNPLLDSYSTFGTKSKAAILERATNHINKVLPLIGSIDRRLISNLFASDKVLSTNKEAMFKSLSAKANDDEIKQWLPSVNSRLFLDLFNRRKRKLPQFENTVWNKWLLDFFKAKNLFYEYVLDDQTQRYSVVREKGQVKEEFLD